MEEVNIREILIELFIQNRIEDWLTRLKFSHHLKETIIVRE